MTDDRTRRDHDRRREKNERKIRFAKARGRKTLSEIAEAVGLSSSTIHAYSTGGCPAADVGIHIAHYLQIELEWWIIGEEASSTAIPPASDHDQSLSSTVADRLNDVKVRLGQIREQVIVLEKHEAALDTSIGLFQPDARPTLDDLASKQDDVKLKLSARREELDFLERQEAGLEAAIRHIKFG